MVSETAFRGLVNLSCGNGDSAGPKKRSKSGSQNGIPSPLPTALDDDE